MDQINVRPRGWRGSGAGRSAMVVLTAVLAFLAALVGPETGRADTELDFTVGDWIGVVNYQDGSFNGCWLVRDYGRTRLFVKLTAGGSLTLNLKNDGWDLGSVQSYRLTLKVDRRLQRQVDAIADGQVIQLHLGEDWDLIAALRAGNRFTLDSGGQPLSFDLKDSSVALQKGLACVARELGSAAGTKNPFGLDSSRNPFAAGPLGQGESDVELSQSNILGIKLLLIAAGVEDPVMLSRGQLAQFSIDMGGSILLAWLSKTDSRVGLLTAWQSSDPQEEVNALVSALDLQCQGRFAAKRDNFTYLPADRKAVQVETACDSADGAFFLNTTVLFQENLALAIIHKADGTNRQRANSISKGLIQVFGKDYVF